MIYIQIKIIYNFKRVIQAKLKKKILPPHSLPTDALPELANSAVYIIQCYIYDFK